MQTPPPKDAWSLHVVILSKCVFVFEIFFLAGGTSRPTTKTCSNFFNPPPEKFTQFIRKKGFFFLRLLSPEMVDFDFEKKKSVHFLVLSRFDSLLFVIGWVLGSLSLAAMAAACRTREI
jgi:hypothetical protein